MVSAVCYVRDYVEIHFDGPTLRIFSRPIVILSQGAEQVDGLRMLINQVVSGASDLREQVILRFRNGMILDVPKRSQTAGPEVVHFVPTNEKGELEVDRMTIWENLHPSR